jgi:hypothetical protein
VPAKPRKSTQVATTATALGSEVVRSTQEESGSS